MKYFGQKFCAPIYQDCEEIDPPVLAPCARCGEFIRSTDSGFAVPVLGEPLLAAYHRACFLRGIVGSVAHQQKRCSCYVAGASCNDDPNLNVRQAAEAALKFWEGGR